MNREDGLIFYFRKDLIFMGMTTKEALAKFRANISALERDKNSWPFALTLDGKRVFKNAADANLVSNFITFLKKNMQENWLAQLAEIFTQNRITDIHNAMAIDSSCVELAMKELKKYNSGVLDKPNVFRMIIMSTTMFALPNHHLTPNQRIIHEFYRAVLRLAEMFAILKGEHFMIQ